MRVLVFITLVALACAARILHSDSPRVIQGQYIVVFNSGISQELRDAHFEILSSVLDGNDTVLSKFGFEDFQGYSAILSALALATVEKDPSVQYIQADQIVSLMDVQSNPTWGLDRIDQVSLPLDQEYHYFSNPGTGVNAYIIDTGIYIQHKEFTGRVTWGANFADKVNEDCQGHGTHVAGTVGGTTYGVAKKVTLIAVKVLDCDGYGTDSGVISGVTWAANHRKSAGKPGVANMSLGGGVSTALDQAVAAAIKGGLTIAVAAGNEDTDACNGSPARVPSAITVGATTKTDTRSSFSNYGTCLDIFAPGSDITSAWIGSTTATKTISGTSMATPHVAGAVAVYLSRNPTAPTNTVATWIVSVASANKVKDPVGSANFLLYSPYQ